MSLQLQPNTFHVLTQDAAYISYAGHHLAITFETPDLQEDVHRIFGKLLTPNPPSVFHTLNIRKTDSGYAIDGVSEMESHTDSQRTTLQHLKFEVIHQFIKLTPNHLWLHAAGASFEGKGVLLSGAWGKGKSTIVSELCERGALYLSDDIVPIDMTSGSLLPFHLTPMRREYQDAHAALSPVEVSNLSKRIIDLSPDSYARDGVQLAAIILPEYAPESTTELVPHSPALTTMTLLENCLNLKTKKEQAVRFLGSLVEQVPVYRLPYNDGATGAGLIIDLLTE